MLIDRYLPSFDVRDRHEGRFAAEPAKVYSTFRSLDLNRSLVIRAIFAIRGLPSRLGDTRPRPASPVPHSFLESAPAAGWVVLDEIPSQERVIQSPQ